MVYYDSIRNAQYREYYVQLNILRAELEQIFKNICVQTQIMRQERGFNNGIQI